MRLHLINPCNPLLSMAQCSRRRKCRVWKPLGLMVIAALTPHAKWDVKQPKRFIDGAVGGHHGVVRPVTLNISRGAM